MAGMKGQQVLPWAQGNGGRRMRCVALLSSLLVLGACGWWDDGESVVGVIGYPDNLAIQAPDTVTAGEPFTVTLRTWGSNGCWRRHRTDVSVDGLVATIVPRDERPGSGRTCTQAPVEIEHEASVTFAEPGDGRVDVAGSDGIASMDVVVE
jgi:hypothetical protein